jgi:hypothetical protein
MSSKKSFKKPKIQRPAASTMFGMNFDDVDALSTKVPSKVTNRDIRRWMEIAKQTKGGLQETSATPTPSAPSQATIDMAKQILVNPDIQKILMMQDELGKKAMMYVEQTKKQREAFSEWFERNGTWVITLIFVVFAFVFYLIVIHNRVERHLTKMNVYNSSAPKSLFDNPDYINQGYRLCDFYVASAFRAYLPCTNKFDYSSEKAVERCIMFGARYIHLDIFPQTFDYNSIPVCCAGEEVGNWNHTTRVPFETVLSVIKTYAFNNRLNIQSTNADPFFLHLTFKCWGQIYVINKVADLIYEYFADNLLDSRYGYCGTQTNENLALEPIELFNRKLVIICDAADNADISNSVMNELSNFNPKMGSNCRYLTYEQIRNSTSLDEIVEYNKKHITIVKPSFTHRNKYNYNFYTPYYLGCQFISMNYTEPDAFMQSYTNRFMEYSMVLKPYKLRYKPLIIPEPRPADRANTFETDVFVPSTGDAIII